jgi:hypothetical protein
MRICENMIDMESIDFQSLTFFKELTAQFVELRKVKKEDIPDSEIINTLSSIIKHHTGLNIAFNFADNDPSVAIPMVNKNNILINSFIRNYINSADGLKMINDSKGVVRGSVNIKTGMVSGIFTEVKSTINIPVYMLSEKSKYEPEEVAAILLHEIGHLFTYYEYMSRTVTTNQMLAGLSKALDNSGTVEQRESVLISVKKAANLKDLDVKELAKSNSSKVAEIVVITNIAKEVKSELGSNIYDFSTWEYLADQYAARNGAGRYLVTALEKLYKGMFNKSFRSLPVFLFMEALKLILLFSPASSISGFLLAMDSDGDGTYDTPEARFKRLRAQIVENLKDKKLSKEDNERLSSDLLTIDDILKNVNDRRQFFGVVYDALAVWNYKDRDQKKLQQNLEAIAVNELFAKSADLRQIA